LLWRLRPSPSSRISSARTPHHRSWALSPWRLSTTAAITQVAARTRLLSKGERAVSGVQAPQHVPSPSMPPSTRCTMAASVRGQCLIRSSDMWTLPFRTDEKRGKSNPCFNIR
jgi:hypothetical protein